MLKMKRIKKYSLTALIDLRSVPASNVCPSLFMTGDCFTGGLWNPCKYFGCVTPLKQRPSTRNSTGSNFFNLTNNGLGATTPLRKMSDFDSFQSSTDVGGAQNIEQTSVNIVSHSHSFSQPQPSITLCSELASSPRTTFNENEFAGFFTDNCRILDHRLSVLSPNHNHNKTLLPTNNSQPGHNTASSDRPSSALSGHVTPLLGPSQHHFFSSPRQHNQEGTRASISPFKNVKHLSSPLNFAACSEAGSTGNVSSLFRSDDLPPPAAQRRRQPSVGSSSSSHGNRNHFIYSPLKYGPQQPWQHQQHAWNIAPSNKPRSCFIPSDFQLLPGDWPSSGGIALPVKSRSSSRHTIELSNTRDLDQLRPAAKQRFRNRTSLLMANISTSGASLPGSPLPLMNSLPPAAPVHSYQSARGTAAADSSHTSYATAVAMGTAGGLSGISALDWPAFLKDKVRGGVVPDSPATNRKSVPLPLLSLPPSDTNLSDFHASTANTSCSSPVRHRPRRPYRRASTNAPSLFAADSGTSANSGTIVCRSPGLSVVDLNRAATCSSQLAEANAGVSPAQSRGAYLLSLIGGGTVGANRGSVETGFFTSSASPAPSGRTRSGNTSFDLTKLELMLKADLKSMKSKDKASQNPSISPPARPASMGIELSCSKVLTVEEIEKTYLV